MTRMVTVHAGPMWEVELLKGRFAEEDIPAFLPDATTKIMDPFITGGNPLDTRLQVREVDAERALELVAEYREATTREEPPAKPEGDLTEDRQARLAWREKLGRRIRWGSILGLILWILAPVVLVLGVTYLWNLKPDEERPPEHGLTIAAIFLAGVVTVLLIQVVVRVAIVV